MKAGGIVFLVFMMGLAMMLYKHNYNFAALVVFLILLASAFSSGKLG